MRAWRLALCGVLCAAACGAIRAADLAPPGTITLDRATVVATLNGWPQAAQEIDLPLHWDVMY
ncbi:MAG: hypothetical protein ACREUC_05615, partial [Steroidobacteraceae bacterium]